MTESNHQKRERNVMDHYKPIPRTCKEGLGTHFKKKRERIPIWVMVVMVVVIIFLVVV